MVKIKSPANIREIRRKRQQKQRLKIILLLGILLGFVSISTVLFLSKSIGFAFGSFFVVVAFFLAYTHFRNKLKEASVTSKMEDSFPDFLQLMASNLRAGMTIDKALLLSSRPEFDPLDKEIMSVGKDIATGRSLRNALLDMAHRVKSERIEKTVLLILSGINAGGNIAVLLEETASNMRERGFVEKRASSSVLMYLIFIFIAATFGAPFLFSLSTILVETLTNILSSIPEVSETTTMNMPFSFGTIGISINFIVYFSVIFVIVNNLLASRILGLVARGDEKYGIKYLLPMLVISLSVFFIVRILLAGYITGFIV